MILLTAGFSLLAPAAFAQSDEADEPSSSEPQESTPAPVESTPDPAPSVQPEHALEITPVPDDPPTEPERGTETPTVNAGPDFAAQPQGAHTEPSTEQPAGDEREPHLDPNIEFAGDKAIEKGGEMLLGGKAGLLLGLPKDNSADSWTEWAVDTATEAIAGPIIGGVLHAPSLTKEGDEIDPKNPPAPFVQDPDEQLRLQTGLDITRVPDSELPAGTAQPADDPPPGVSATDDSSASDSPPSVGAPPDQGSGSSSTESPSYDQNSGASDTGDSSGDSGGESSDSSDGE